MVELIVCPQCSRPISGQDTFCSECGAQVTPVPREAETISGVKLTDGDDLLLEKLRESTVGEYEIRGLLGRGGMASVFVAYDLALNRKVALKVMHPGLLGDSGMRERFRLEARLAARLDHPNIVTVHSVKERARIVFFDLKLVDGLSLDRLIRHRQAPMPDRLARWITAKIADALHYAHSQAVVHRDMKPANVMIERRGDCVVTDFGIAKAAESPHLTQTGAVVGTPAYMSPEQCLGNEITAASDQYSLGILAYELLVGEVPFSGSLLNIQLGHVEKIPPAPHTRVPAVPRAASDVVMRMIAKNPAERWPTLAEAAEALVEGLGASDAQMRRELSAMIAAVPAEAGRPSLPATPRSPTPHSLRATTAPVTASATTAPPSSVQEIVTEVMPLTPVRATPIVSADAIESSRRSSMRATLRKRMIPLGAVTLVSVAVVAAIASLGGRKTSTAAPVPSPDSAIVAAPAADTSLNAQLDVSDTVVTRVGVDPFTASLRVGDSLHFSAIAYAVSGDAVKKRMQWSSSDSTLVIVNRDGWVHAIARTGTSPVFITATAGKRSGVAAIKVTP